jgi:hypothetical protein
MVEVIIIDSVSILSLLTAMISDSSDRQRDDKGDDGRETGQIE